MIKKLLLVLVILFFVFISGCSTKAVEYLRQADGYYHEAKDVEKEIQLYNEQYSLSKNETLYKLLETLKERYKINMDLAEILYFKALTAEPHISDSLLLGSSYCFFISKNALDKKDLELFKSAVDCHLRRIDLFPNDLYSYDWLIYLYYNMEKYDEALKIAEKMLLHIPSQTQSVKYDSSFVNNWIDKLKNVIK